VRVNEAEYEPAYTPDTVSEVGTHYEDPQYASEDAVLRENSPFGY